MSTESVSTSAAEDGRARAERDQLDKAGVQKQTEVLTTEELNLQRLRDFVAAADGYEVMVLDQMERQETLEVIRPEDCPPEEGVDLGAELVGQLPDQPWPNYSWRIDLLEPIGENLYLSDLNAMKRIDELGDKLNALELSEEEESTND